MRAMVHVLVVAMLAGPSARAGGLAGREQAAGGVDEPRHTGLGKILSVVEYDREIGKIARVHCRRVKADRPEAAGRILVRVKSDATSRREALQVEESIVQSIVRKTPHRTVGSARDADMILEVELESAGPAGR